MMNTPDNYSARSRNTEEQTSHLRHLERSALKLCKHFGFDPDYFGVSSYLLGRNGPANDSAIYIWLFRRYGAEDNWGSFIDFDECVGLIREDLVKHIPDHDLGYILI